MLLEVIDLTWQIAWEGVLAPCNLKLINCVYTKIRFLILPFKLHSQAGQRSSSLFPLKRKCVSLQSHSKHELWRNAQVTLLWTISELGRANVFEKTWDSSGSLRVPHLILHRQYCCTQLTLIWHYAPFPYQQQLQEADQPGLKCLICALSQVGLQENFISHQPEIVFLLSFTWR